MGQHHSELAHMPAVHFNPQYEVLQKVNDPHYGEVKHVRDTKTGDKMLLKQFFFNHKKAFEHEASYLSKAVRENHPHVVTAIGYNFEDDHGFCSAHYKISLFIEHIQHNLQSELEERKKSRKIFPENEVVQIAEELISALTYFQNKGIAHGDVRPYNIFILDKKYKVSDPALNAHKGSNGLTQAIIHHAQTFLAPELLVQVPKSRFDFSANPFKADVFSVGVTLLSLATLTDGEALYDYKKGMINTVLLEQRLDAVRHLYSDSTYQMLRSMLSLDHHTRPDFIDLTKRPAGLQRMPRMTPQETVKKSVLVADYHAPLRTGVPRLDSHSVDTPIQEDDLDAKVRAALDRSRRTLTLNNFDVQKEDKGDTTIERTIDLGAPKEEGVKASGSRDYQNTTQQQQQQQRPYSGYNAGYGTGYNTSYNNYMGAPTSTYTYTPSTNYNTNAGAYPYSYSVNQTNAEPARTYEVENTVKACPYENVGTTYTYNPAPVPATTAYKTNTEYPQYTGYSAAPQKSSPNKEEAQVTTESKPHQVFPDYQSVQSYTMNPSPTYQPNQQSPGKYNEGGDKTPVSINVGGHPSRNAGENQGNFGYYTTNVAPITYATGYDVTNAGYQQTPAVNDLAFFQRATEGTNAMGIVDYFGAR